MQLDSDLTKEPRDNHGGDAGDEVVKERHSWRVSFEDSEKSAVNSGVTMGMWPVYFRGNFVGLDGGFDVRKAGGMFKGKRIR